jgi:hypothetical protein
MSKFYFFKPAFHQSHNNLKVVNDKGQELSLTGDDSCGAMQHYARLSMALFTNEEREYMVGEEKFAPTPEDFLMALAAHLGYNVSPKDQQECETEEYQHERCVKCDGNLLDNAERKEGYCHLCKTIG